MSEQPSINRAYVLLSTALAEIQASGYIRTLQAHLGSTSNPLREKAIRRIDAINQLKQLVWDLAGDWQ
jgi:hypothetical protein